jgi:membrane protein DedA with SNARE-associated domain
VDWITQAASGVVEAVAQAGYPGIFVLMFLASSVLPVPSQAALIPAGFLAFQGRLAVPLVLASSVLGTLCGALSTYGLALWPGRPFLERHGRWLLLTPDRLARVDRFVERHGEIGTFLGRMVTGVRHLIALPAGLSRMPLPRFVLCTVLGGALYDGAEVAVGYLAGGNADLLVRYSRQAVAALAAVCVGGLAIHAWRTVRRRS